MRTGGTPIFGPDDLQQIRFQRPPERDIYQPCHTAGMLFCWQTFTTDWFINKGGLQLRIGENSSELGSNPNCFLQTLWGVIFKRTFTIHAVQQKQMAKNYLCSSPKLFRTDSVMFIHVHSFSMHGRVLHWTKDANDGIEASTDVLQRSCIPGAGRSYICCLKKKHVS